MLLIRGCKKWHDHPKYENFLPSQAFSGRLIFCIVPAQPGNLMLARITSSSSDGQGLIDQFSTNMYQLEFNTFLNTILFKQKKKDFVFLKTKKQIRKIKIRSKILYSHHLNYALKFLANKKNHMYIYMGKRKAIG